MVEIVKSVASVSHGLEDPSEAMRAIETAGRISHASEAPGTPDATDRFVRMLVRLGHESVLEHWSVTVHVKTDRATAQQWTRHRLAAYTMVSQRYVDGARHGISFADPEFSGNNRDEAYHIFTELCGASVCAYTALRKLGMPPEDARSVLPNATLTEFYTTANLRSWRHFFSERCKPQAQHNIRQLALSLLSEMHSKLPAVFYDLIDVTK